MSNATPALPHGKRYFTVRQMPQAYPGVTEGMVRWYRFNGDTNGFNCCVLVVGRKLLIDAEAFEQWLESHRDGQVANAEAFEPRLASHKVYG
jgi:hypothetical protein